MRSIRLQRPGLMICLGALGLVTGMTLAEPRTRTAISIQHDVVWVYYTSLCARAGDAGECTIVPTEQRQAFPSHQACAAHRDADLAREANPRLLGSCSKQHEA